MAYNYLLLLIPKFNIEGGDRMFWFLTICCILAIIAILFGPQLIDAMMPKCKTGHKFKTGKKVFYCRKDYNGRTIKYHANIVRQLSINDPPFYSREPSYVIKLQHKFDFTHFYHKSGCKDKMFVEAMESELKGGIW